MYSAEVFWGNLSRKIRTNSFSAAAIIQSTSSWQCCTEWKEKVKVERKISEAKQNKTKQNKTKQNKTKQNKTKQNKTKSNCF